MLALVQWGSGAGWTVEDAGSGDRVKGFGNRDQDRLWCWETRPKGPALVLGDQGQVQAGLPMLSLLLSPLPCRSTL